MADEKKAGDKAPPPPQTDPFAEILWIVPSLFVSLYVLNKLVVIIKDLISGDLEANFFIDKMKSFFAYFLDFLPFIKIVLAFASVVAVFLIVHLFKKLKQLRLNEKNLLYPEVSSSVSRAVNPHWERIINHIESLNKNDWRLAIIEADIMLSGVLDRLQLPGDTMGEKLKAVEKSDFTTVDSAWEAHKIRNQIAHEGEAFVMTQRESRRVIELYRQVFEEFAII